MKKIILWLMAILPVLCAAQTITVPLPPGIVYQSQLEKTDARLDSLVKALRGVVVPPPVIQDPVAVKDSCVYGPNIAGISKITNTGAVLLFDALQVTDINYTITNEVGAPLYTDSLLNLQSNSVPFKYQAFPNGSYYLKISGRSCLSKVSQRKFTITTTGGVVVPPPVVVDPPQPSVGGREFYMNATGSGFDLDAPNGIGIEWQKAAEILLNLEWKGEKFKGITGIRLNTRWYAYEPKDNVYRDDVLVRALEWCKARGIKLAICIVLWRAEGDGMFPDGHKTMLANGERWTDNPGLPSIPQIYMPSMSSDLMHTKLERVTAHMGSVMASYGNVAGYISIVTAPTEEFQLVRREEPMTISGFADVDKEKWAIWSGGQPMPTYDEVRSEEQLNYFTSTPKGQSFYLFQTDALRKTQVAATRGARKGGVQACGMYAGIGAPSGVFDFSTKLNTIFSAGTPDQPDIIYSSEGGSHTQNWKLMATDLNLGTFPGARVAIEFDWDDVSWSQAGFGKEEGFNPYLLYNYTESFHRRGGDIPHLAMGYPDYILRQMAEPLYMIKKKFRDTNEGMTGIQQGTEFVFPITRYSGLQGFRQEWYDRGGGINKQVKFKLQ
ncbi:hypothetical protein [Dyadobacter sp. CY323]|uniref:hypothetical protein n=1 Tax=Dyadobacter sp. CY323 TaxID=2907302 RepID=UPI001F16AFDE|nr:hypothetical protein [Dyadobacter sp. CY323]MCE6992111.1 hypothetical protein [Dyadobacter sp. CY323]